MTQPELIFVAVDRVEGSFAILQSDSGGEYTVSTIGLTPRPTEGRIYRVPMGIDGQPVWASAVFDPTEEVRRRNELAERMKVLRKSDPGGDVKL